MDDVEFSVALRNLVINYKWVKLIMVAQYQRHNRSWGAFLRLIRITRGEIMPQRGVAMRGVAMAEGHLEEQLEAFQFNYDLLEYNVETTPAWIRQCWDRRLQLNSI